MPEPVDLSVVVPVYRNAPTLQLLADQVSAVAADLAVSFEIVFVNDASPDDSLARLMELAANRSHIVVIDLSSNVGQHAAVLHGLAHARGRACVIMDADLQDRPASLALLWRARATDVSAVFGGRRGRYEGAGRHVTSRLFKELLHRLTGVPRDAGIFVLIERPLVDAIVRFPTTFPWIQAMIGCLGARVASTPVDRDLRQEGRSSYNGLGRLKTAARGILCVVEYRLWRRKRPYLEAIADHVRPRVMTSGTPR